MDQITKGKEQAKKYTAQGVIDLLRDHYGCRFMFAVWRHGNGYLAVREKYGPVLFDYALDNGHRDPNFMGFYGRFSGWKYFAEDVGLVEVAA